MFAIKSPFESEKVIPLALNKTSSNVAKVALDMLSTPWFVVVTIKFEFVEVSLLNPYTSAELAFPNSKAVAPELTFKTWPAVPKELGTSLASVILKLANWKVP